MRCRRSGSCGPELAQGRELRWELEQESKTLQDKLQAMDASIGGKVPELVALRARAADCESRAAEAEAAAADLRAQLARHCPAGQPSREQLAGELDAARAALAGAQGVAARVEVAENEAAQLAAALQESRAAAQAGQEGTGAAEARAAELQDKLGELEAVLRSHVSGAEEARRAAEAELAALRASSVEGSTHAEVVEELHDTRRRLSELETAVWTLAGVVPGDEQGDGGLAAALGELEGQQAELHSLRHALEEQERQLSELGVGKDADTAGLRQQLEMAQQRADEAEAKLASLPNLRDQVAAGERQRQSLETKLARFGKQVAEMEGWKTKAEAAAHTVRRLQAEISRLRATGAPSHANSADSELFQELEASLGQLSEKSAACAELERRVEELSAQCEGAAADAAAARREAEADRQASRQQLDAAQEEVQTLKQQMGKAQTSGSAKRVAALEKQLGAMKEYAEQLRVWAEHGRALEEAREASGNEAAELRARAEEAEAVVDALAGRLEGDGAAALAELRRALAVAHRDRQALEQRLAELSGGARGAAPTDEGAAQRQGAAPLSDQLSFLQAKLASVQEEADQRCASADAARAHAEKAIRAMACGFEHMLERGLADPASRAGWPGRLRDLVAGYEAAAAKGAGAARQTAEDGGAAAQLALELAAVSQAAAQAAHARDQAAAQLAHAEQRSHRLEAELAAQEAALLGAAAAEEERWAARVEAARREGEAAGKAGRGGAEVEERARQRLAATQSELALFKERARAMLEERDLAIATLKAQVQQQAAAPAKPEEAAGSGRPGPGGPDGACLQQVVRAGLASGALHVAPSLQRVLTQLQATEPSCLDGAYLASVVAKGLESGELGAEPSLRELLAHLLHLDPAKVVDLCNLARPRGRFVMASATLPHSVYLLEEFDDRTPEARIQCALAARGLVIFQDPSLHRNPTGVTEQLIDCSGRD
eukprot:jgi/Tetstr1/432432/TSEL_002320.t1